MSSCSSVSVKSTIVNPQSVRSGAVAWSVELGGRALGVFSVMTR
jgi:hypothetical protein